MEQTGDNFVVDKYRNSGGGNADDTPQNWSHYEFQNPDSDLWWIDLLGSMAVNLHHLTSSQDG